MSCILRVSGDSLDVAALLERCSLPPDRTWRKGEPRRIAGKVNSRSGATFLASDADLDDFAGQLAEATAFLESNAETIASLAGFPGVTDSTLDFGVTMREGYLAQYCHLPARFIQLAARVGISVEVSYYGTCDFEQHG